MDGHPLEISAGVHFSIVIPQSLFFAATAAVGFFCGVVVFAWPPSTPLGHEEARAIACGLVGVVVCAFAAKEVLRAGVWLWW